MDADFSDPPYRHGSTGGTAEAAAEYMRPRAPALRLQVLDIIEHAPATGERVWAILRERGVKTVLYSVKPRLSELKNAGLVADSGARGVSDSGRLRSVVWRATSPEERAQFLARKAVADEKGPANG